MPRQLQPYCSLCIAKRSFSAWKASFIGHDAPDLTTTTKSKVPLRAIVASLYYFNDCLNILRHAREKRRVKVNDRTISVYQDYTARVASARGACNGIRQQPRGTKGPSLWHSSLSRTLYYLRWSGEDFYFASKAQIYITQDIAKQATGAC